MKHSDFSKIKKRCVFFDQDGHPEDIVSMIILLNLKNVDVIGISYTPADSYQKDGLELTLKMLEVLGKNIPVGISSFRSPNEYPESTRIPCIQANHLPSFILQKTNKNLISKKPAHELMADIIKQSKEKITVLVTGPISNLMGAIKHDPSIKNNIEEVVWAAGAITIPGNVLKFDNRNQSEWNMHWDAISAKDLFKSGLKVSLFPLELTQTVEMDMELLKQVSQERTKYNMTDLIGQIFAIIYPVNDVSSPYYLKNCVTCAYLGCDDLVSFHQDRLDVLTKAPKLGKLIKTDDVEHQLVNVANKVKLEVFRPFFVKSLKCHATFTMLKH